MAMQKSDLKGALPLIASGKVRDLYIVDDSTLLFVATDRISAFDVVMENPIPEKGKILTQMSAYWFGFLSKNIPSLKTHFISVDLPPAIPEELHSSLKNRSMQVKRLKIFPIEAIVRGYITGSAWNEYKRDRTVNGMQMPPGLRESQAFPCPIYTPSTKAEQGEQDENISIARAAEIVGSQYADRIEKLALELYTTAAQYAYTKGIIIADTKFEFGLDEETDEIVLVDEVLTPDSSRFWPAEQYEIGKSQPSFDKQFLRDWLIKEGLKGKEGVTIPDEIVQQTKQKYEQIFEVLTSKEQTIV